MLHKKVQIVIIDCSHKGPKALLLQTNKKRGEFWQNVTGSVEGDETFFLGARRELEEETGIKSSNLFDLNFNFKFKDRHGKEVVEQVFVALLEHTPTKIKLDPHEHQDFKWKTLDAITADDFKFPTNFEAFVKARARAK
ncbi:MAG: NUDIX domain-containing protein [Deltaproteobacteria bacterium]|nr:MAG: NUDIX domain-containing protein [Deltaproteobacteria bacterium]